MADHSAPLFRLAAVTVWRRELIHFWREKTRVAGFLVMPMLFWAVLGSGFGNARDFFAGSLLLSVMFTAVFSTMSVIEDRREGFLLSMLVSPAPRSALALGKILGGATAGTVQGLLFALALPLAGAPWGDVNWPLAILSLFLIGFAFTAFGLVIALRCQSTQGFHAIINVVLMPLWMLSGAMFPRTESVWLRAVMKLNPLSSMLALLDRAFTPSPASVLLPGHAPPVAGVIVTLAACIAFFVASSRRLKVAFLAVLFVVSTGCASLSSGLPEMGKVPPFRLTAQDGNEFKGDALNGQVWVANFIFTTCNGPCPRMTAQMRKVQDATKELADVKIVSFTVDPANDTPSALNAYANRFNADPARWFFLTGEREELKKLADDTFHLHDMNMASEHGTRFALVDRKGRIRNYYGSTDTNAINELVADVQKLRTEAF